MPAKVSAKTAETCDRHNVNQDFPEFPDSVTDENHCVKYRVHYKGWKKTWDEWVPPLRLLQDTVANRAMHADVLVIVPGARSRVKVGPAGPDKDATTGALEWNNARGTGRAQIHAIGSPEKPPGSPDKTPSFANPTKSSAAKAVAPKTRARTNPLGFPSPIQRKVISATSSSPSPSFPSKITGPGSSLQLLASALEKLRLPLPERPNTSMGLPRSAGARSVGMRSVAVRCPSMSSIAPPLSKVTGSRSLGPDRIAKRSSSRVEAFTGTKVSSRRILPSAILKGCVVYVDVISASGDASVKAFITEKLQDMGARVLNCVGHTLTYIVYKNGLGRTLNLYRRLPNPKPLVVGMEWVVQSEKIGTHVDETSYLIEIDDMNTTGTKRPKAMLPRSMSGLDNTDAIPRSSVAPLEKARLRKAATLTI
ncbi:hypothetical protein B0H13DRAFT_2481272 [Mycena leptocephala]|nr:hypothetical protein B0H13DRAFT_2481272 [Mycena leptocephala]